jgi:hypothetical protein
MIKYYSKKKEIEDRKKCNDDRLGIDFRTQKVMRLKPTLFGCDGC